MANERRRKAVTNEVNTRDRIGKGKRHVLPQHKGKVPKVAPKMKNLQRKAGNR
jgi:hypothetical protein